MKQDPNKQGEKRKNMEIHLDNHVHFTYDVTDHSFDRQASRTSKLKHKPTRNSFYLCIFQCYQNEFRSLI